ncbi:hypothetical protein OEV98_11105 [Caldibacillus lycopersici]|uniref:Uncharacterized protein n=1 Tax=Perspicuibacillus lycopersici TaxID=1325689 RepID=A0AAE3IT30_9BACI|nr:hypothetical protein [Perspicuibacillus lycopersici]MCU9614108.1 hypothetical protein [Perspicuibacillus lycopersici]
MLTKREIENLKKYSFLESGHLAKVYETVDGKFNVCPIKSPRHHRGDKMISCERLLAQFDTREEAEKALIDICGYSKSFVESLR